MTASIPHSAAFLRALHEGVEALKKGRDVLRLKYQVIQGRVLGPGCFEHQEEATLGHEGGLTLFRRKEAAEAGEEYPGLYVGKLDVTEITNLLQALAISPLHVPSSEPASPTDASHRLQLTLDGQPFAFTWGSLSPEERDVRLPALMALAHLLAHPSLSPRWCLALELEAIARDSGGFTATLRLANTGSEPIECAIPGEGNAYATVQLQHAVPVVSEPGITPLPLEVMLSAGFPVGVNAPIQTLVPGGSLAFKAEFDAPTEPRPMHVKFAYRQWALPEDFAGARLFQGEVFSRETLA